MGGRNPTVSDREIIKIIALHPEPIVASKDLMNKLDMTQPGVTKRLNKLVDKGLLHDKQVGSSANVYWLSDDALELLSKEPSGQDNQ